MYAVHTLPCMYQLTEPCAHSTSQSGGAMAVTLATEGAVLKLKFMGSNIADCSSVAEKAVRARQRSGAWPGFGVLVLFWCTCF